MGVPPPQDWYNEGGAISRIIDKLDSQVDRKTVETVISKTFYRIYEADLDPDSKYRHLTTLGRLRQPGYVIKHENGQQGLKFEMLRPTDALVGNKNYGNIAQCKNYEGSIAFSDRLKQFKECVSNGNQSFTSTEVFIKFIRELMDPGPNRIRFMRQYKGHPDGEELWGNIGGVKEYVKYVQKRLRHGKERGIWDDVSDSEEN